MREVFGAKAKVFIQFEKNIFELNKQISEGLMIPDFLIEHDEYAPFKLKGTCEALGFQLWLMNIEDSELYNYVLEIETEVSEIEVFHGKMYDLSLWLGRFIYKVCGISTFVQIETGEIINYS